MHQPIRDYLEDHLRGQATPEGFRAHLETCEDCAGEIRGLEQQSRTLRSLASPEVEPRAGFYARVMDRIESRRTSVWSLFLERKLGLRIAVASAAMALLLGAYLVGTDPGAVFSSGPSVVFTDNTSAAVADLQTEQVQQQRDAVLVDLASYHE